MGQLERYGLYVLCLVIFLILGVAVWGEPSARKPRSSGCSGRCPDRGENCGWQGRSRWRQFCCAGVSRIGGRRTRTSASAMTIVSSRRLALRPTRGLSGPKNQPASSAQTYIVQGGDSFARIAKRELGGEPVHERDPGGKPGGGSDQAPAWSETEAADREGVERLVVAAQGEGQCLGWSVGSLGEERRRTEQDRGAVLRSLDQGASRSNHACEQDAKRQFCRSEPSSRFRLVESESLRSESTHEGAFAWSVAVPAAICCRHCHWRARCVEPGTSPSW